MYVWVITIGRYNAGSRFEEAESAEDYVNNLSESTKDRCDISTPFPDRVIIRVKEVNHG